MKLVQVCQSNNKLYQERLGNLEITFELLKKDNLVLKEYSICYPNEEDEMEQEENIAEARTKSLECAENNYCLESSSNIETPDTIIENLEAAKAKNAIKIQNLNERLRNLEDEQRALKVSSVENKNKSIVLERKVVALSGEIKELKESTNTKITIS